MVYKLSFRIRKIYYDQIVAGTKTAEFRAVKPFWIQRVLKAVNEIQQGHEVRAVFVCGSRTHCRAVITVRYWRNAQEALGRPPSEQGHADLGDGPVFGFELGNQRPGKDCKGCAEEIYYPNCDEYHPCPFTAGAEEVPR